MSLFQKTIISKYLKTQDPETLDQKWENVCTTLQGGFYDFRRDKISTIPIPKNSKDFDSNLCELGEKQIQNTNELNSLINKFQRTLQREFSLEKLTKKLESWYELSYADFLNELKKQKIELSLSQKVEWEDYFSRTTKSYCTKKPNQPN